MNHALPSGCTSNERAWSSGLHPWSCHEASGLEREYESFRRIVTSKSAVGCCEDWETMWNFPSSSDARFSFSKDADTIQSENFTKNVAYLDY